MEERVILHVAVPLVRGLVLYCLIHERRSSGTPNVIAEPGTIDMRDDIYRNTATIDCCMARQGGGMRCYPGEIPIGWCYPGFSTPMPPARGADLEAWSCTDLLYAI
jgi:hypothetical protein